ncbi:hypothetical protein FF86_102225, partial [Frankia sp. CpI1-P]
MIIVQIDRFRKVCASKSGGSKIRIVQLGVGEICAAQIGMAKIQSTQIGAEDIGVAEVCSTDPWLIWKLTESSEGSLHVNANFHFCMTDFVLTSNRLGL